MKFVKNSPAVFIEDMKAVAITDLHIGFEYTLYKSGVKIPKQTEKMKNQVKSIIKKTGSERLIILGDIKHEVPGTSFQERRDVPDFFDGLLDIADIEITPGNHDSNIGDLLPSEVKVHGRSGFRDGDYYFSHGHTWPSEELLKTKFLIMGHAHPVIEFKDSFGYRILRPIFLKGFLDDNKVEERYGEKRGIELLSLPVFNDLFGGTPIGSKIENNLLGPIFRNDFVDVGECEAYLLDGTFVGKVRDV